MAAVPIWKDFIAELSGTYRIVSTATGNTIYSGYAVAKPGDTYAQVRINDICADYLENVLPSLTHRDVTALAMGTFKVQMRVPGPQGYQWVDLYSPQFYNDWSYDYDHNPSVSGISFPINGHIDARQPILFSVYDKAQVNVTLVFKNGTSQTLVIPVTGGGGGGGGTSGDFNMDFSNDFLVGGGGGEGTDGYGTIAVRAGNYSNLDRVVMGGKTFKVVTNCAKYVLFYVNAFGGWDSLLIEGNTLEADSLNRFTREVVYDNRQIQNRGIHNYVNEVTKGFTFHSGWLLNDQGERMHHLINSTFVYLYDISNDDMIPVIITDTSCEYKTFKNQGNMLVDYTIQVEVAQHRERR